MNKKLLEIFKNERVYVHFDDKEEAKSFLEDCHEYHLDWWYEEGEKQIILENEFYNFIFDNWGDGFLQFITHTHSLIDMGYIELNYSMENDYTLKEVISIIESDETYISKEGIKISCSNDKLLKLSSTENKEIEFYKDTLFTKEVPMNFSEAIKQGEKIRIEHELLKNHSFAEQYCSIAYVLTVLGTNFRTPQIKDIIENGKCYIEK